jgi:hypothetical protein
MEIEDRQEKMQKLNGIVLVAEYVAGCVPVMVGSAFQCPTDTLRFFDEIADLSIDAYHLLPTDRKLGPEAAQPFIVNVANRCPKPQWQ